MLWYITLGVQRLPPAREQAGQSLNIGLKGRHAWDWSWSSVCKIVLRYHTKAHGDFVALPIWQIDQLWLCLTYLLRNIPIPGKHETRPFGGSGCLQYLNPAVACGSHIPTFVH